MMCAMEETSDTLTLAAGERAKQGIHELEISFGGELDLHKHFHLCEKNPRHLKFIPVNIFKQNNLPKHRHSHKIAAWIRQISDLTVKLSVNYVSPHRPSEYPLSDRAGQRVLTVGSGFVTDISFTENNNKMPCPLKNCRLLPGYHVVCGYITIVTAAHVVFDDEEAKNTTVEFFYDDSSDRRGVMIASGVRVAASSVEGDFCELLCVTHETKLFERLKYKLMYAKKETLDTLTLAEESAKQLMQELEIGFGGELDLLKHFDKNSKNPGHPNLIQVNKLEEWHHPKHRHSHKITECEKISDFTVKLSVNYVSPNRPSGYPLSDRAGQRVLSVGSGFVADISLTRNNGKMPCPLKNCGHLPGYHVVCGYITIVTAAHVVFDDEEAKNTTAEIVYDDSTDRSGVMIASGVRVAASSVEGDFRALVCVTHETKLFERFKYEFVLSAKNKAICQMFRTLLPELVSIQYASGTGSHFLAKTRLSNPTETVKASIVLKAFRTYVIDRVLTYWNPSKNSLSDVLENISFSKQDILALILEIALSLWDSSRRCHFGNIHKVEKISNGIVTIDSKYAYHDSKNQFDDIENVFDRIKYRLKGIKYVHNIYRKGESNTDNGENNPDDMFLVHIAHPHGQSKHVTVGRQTDCFTGDGFYHQLYTAPTCPGCSGGPVWMIPASGDLSEVYGVPHSGCHGNQLNKGCSWTVYPF